MKIDWFEAACKGVSAVSGIAVFLACLYGGMAMIWLVMKAPDAFATITAASIVAAALYFRKPVTTYNLQIGHPDTERVLRDLEDVMARYDGN